MTGVHTVQDFGPSDLLTDSRFDVRRVKTEVGAAKFTSGEEFRFIDEYIDVPASSQIVYQVTLTNPIEVFGVTLGILTGGRKYKVYRASEVTFTPAADPVTCTILPLNSDPVGGIKSTGGSFIRHVGADIVVPNTPPTGSGVNFVNVSYVQSSGNVNQTSGGYSQDGTRFRVPATSIFIVLEHFGSNIASEGFIKIEYAEDLP